LKYLFTIIFLINSSFASVEVTDINTSINTSIDTKSDINTSINTKSDMNISTDAKSDMNTSTDIKIDTNTTIVDYHYDIKHYLNSAQALGINIQKGALRVYYKKTKYELIWFDDKTLNTIYEELIKYSKNDQIISTKARKNFNILEIEELLSQYKENTLSPTQTLQLDFLLTNLYDEYIKCVSRGSIDWKIFKDELKEMYEEDDIVANWEKYSAKVNRYKLLKETLEEKDFLVTMNKINYSYPNANKLNNKLLDYEKILKSGGYNIVPTVHKALKIGMHSSIVPQLKTRLIQSNDLVIVDNNITNNEKVVDTNITKKSNNIYTKEIAKAVKSFQKNHGLEVDGICGKDTIKHLNITVKKKIYQIRVNLERMRWMRRDLGKEYLLVNIPDYNLRYYKNKKEVLKLSVVVGTKKHPTPVFSHRLSTVVLNPYWRVPKRIVQREIIPKLVEDSNYLSNKDMNVHEGWSNESPMFDPTEIDWSLYAQNDEQKEQKEYPEVPYKFIQTPGIKNPLGKMKFLFRNRYMVYLHDTSARYLFSKRKRAFSHGCIRVHNPSKLLKTIAKKDKSFDYKEAKVILKDVNQTEITLTKRIPIHIVYLTAWIDDNNKMQFRDDIYGYDKMQSNILY